MVINSGGERLYLVDEHSREIPCAEKALLLFVRLVAATLPSGRKIALPLTVTRLAEEIAAP